MTTPYAFASRHIDKPWGYELIWAESESYVGKVLFVRAGQALSLQYHEEKVRRLLSLPAGHRAPRHRA